MKMAVAVLTFATAAALAQPAQATPRQHPTPRAQTTVMAACGAGGDRCQTTPQEAQKAPAATRRTAQAATRSPRQAQTHRPPENNASAAAVLADATATEPQVLGGRSGTCLKFPKTRGLWCGCGSADEVGLPNEDGHWNLASNWFELPRAAPGHNMACVRNGHVSVLKREAGAPNLWMAYDPNSGGGRARLHVINIDRNCAAIVDPKGQPTRSAHRYHRRIRLAHR